MGHIIAMICLAAYLLFVGVLTLFGLHFDGENTVLGLLALAAGAILLISSVSEWRGRTTP